MTDTCDKCGSTQPPMTKFSGRGTSASDLTLCTNCTPDRFLPPSERNQSGQHEAKYPLRQPRECPPAFEGFTKPANQMGGKCSDTTKTAYLILTENQRELGLMGIVSIDEFPERDPDYHRCDLRTYLYKTILIEAGGQSIPEGGLEEATEPRVSIEIETKPSVALQQLSDSGESGHRWNPIGEALNVKSKDDVADIIISVDYDHNDFGITPDGGPHNAIQQWEREGAVPQGWADRAVTGDVRPEDILRHLGIPLVVLSDLVPNIEQARQLARSSSD